MDYFGLIEDNNFTDLNNSSVVRKCATLNCTNDSYTYGTYFLPYCDKTCMKSNIEYLFLENAKLKGEISAMECILTYFYQTKIH